MRIALFTDTCLPTVNGVARALGLLCRHGAEAGHEVALVSPRVGDAAHPDTALHLTIPGIALPPYPELQAARPWLGGAHHRALADFRPDVVHAATEALVGMAGRRWALRRGVPLVTSYCTNFPDYLPEYGLGLAQGWCWGHLRRFHDAGTLTFCPSRATLEELRRRGFHDRLRIWSRGVDADLFSPTRRSAAVRDAMAPGAEVILLYVGRIAPEKRVDLLIEAFPRIRERCSAQVHLVFVGGGPARSRLEELEMEGVHFAGYRRGEELAAHYASADLFVFPSDTETFGQVVTEAMASGLPVVAPARGGVMDHVVPGETGQLFEPGDVDGLVDRVLALVQDPSALRAMGRRARRYAEGRRWSEVFRRLFADYADASSGRYGGVTSSSPVRRSPGPS